MRVVNKDEFRAQYRKLLRDVGDGALFVYPTDNMYAIGCDATNDSAVSELRKAKRKYTKPFAIIAPSKEWVRQNCIVTKEAENWLSKLPGPYTLELRLKNPAAVSKHVTLYTNKVLVRIPKHWTTQIARRLDKPLVRTAANVGGREPMTDMDNLDETLTAKASFVIDEGEIHSKAGALVSLV
ncbi:Sua5/YciO/YrdC/YwlC family protein [Candidatus Woesearchaeota archaeon]|nr:Sua5/YciO/YrdC/YwlC family protein [Candidatus Woesearchaeota archaeon]